ncbi:hypothetical protein LPC08_01775 [Roseomonas sp. OT10]|uniref:hypothetical protein n=1 Tax=Roseomonas cutis TaxID=2897332 RepID=UPI001E30E069|nr:hypothetical protein [Roseomonas sp. OT10]UFN49400.1 hypothetical protein LPC08_01775 [Roseomonas sp. OT10]
MAHLRANETAKLRASFYNGLSIACFAAGAFAPVAAAFYGSPATEGWKTVLGAILWTSAAFFIHTAGTRELRALKEDDE